MFAFEGFCSDPPQELSTEHPVLWPLSRAKFVLSAILLPVLASNIQAPVLQSVFASDASNHKGAFCEAPLPEPVATLVWQSGDFKGGYSCLEPFPHQFIRSHDGLDESELAEALDDGGWTLPGLEAPPDIAPSRTLAQYFDFIEICGGSGVLSDEMNRRGFCVRPIIDIT